MDERPKLKPLMSIKWYSYPGAGAVPIMAYTGGGGGRGAAPGRDFTSYKRGREVRR